MNDVGSESGKLLQVIILINLHQLSWIMKSYRCLELTAKYLMANAILMDLKL